MWTIIIFPKDNSIEVVPVNWLIGENGEMCYWPPKGSNTMSLIINSAQPSEKWEVYETRFPNNNKKTFDDYLKARNMCTALADDSEITDEGPVKRKRKKRTFSSSEDEDQAKSSLPSPPPPPKNSKDMHTINTKISNPRVEPSAERAVILSNVTTTSIPSLGASSATATSNYDSRVLRQLVLINNKIDNLSKDICCILEKQERLDRASTMTTEDGEAIDQDFPLKSVEEIDNFEEALQNKEYYAKFVNYISLLGGSSTWDGAKRAMERCFTDDIAQLFSWHGMKGKKSFGTMKFAKGVIEGIKKNGHLKTETDLNVEKSIKSWLRHAKERVVKKMRNSNK